VWSHGCTSKLFRHILNSLKLRLNSTYLVATHIHGLLRTVEALIHDGFGVVLCVCVCYCGLCVVVCVLWGHRCSSWLHSCVPRVVCCGGGDRCGSLLHSCLPSHWEGVVHLLHSLPVWLRCVCVVVVWMLITHLLCRASRSSFPTPIGH
jgi:hypothetical protein